MNFAILYVHGFASAGCSVKGRILAEEYPGFNVLTPTLSADPETAVKQLEQLTQTCKNIVMVGSSLGGFYADYFNIRYDIPCVLVNPLVDADDLTRFIGQNTNMYTGETFIFSERQLRYLKKLQAEKIRRGYPDVPECIFVAEDDELLDPAKARGYFQAENQILLFCRSGGHRFENKELFVSGVRAMLDAVSDIDFSSPFSEQAFDGVSLSRLRERLQKIR